MPGLASYNGTFYVLRDTYKFCKPPKNRYKKNKEKRSQPRRGHMTWSRMVTTSRAQLHDIITTKLICPSDKEIRTNKNLKNGSYGSVNFGSMGSTMLKITSLDHVVDKRRLASNQIASQLLWFSSFSEDADTVDIDNTNASNRVLCTS